MNKIFFQAQFSQVFSNITNIYEKIKVNRQNIKKKCSKKRCDSLKTNIVKLKASVSFLQDTNITILETMVEMIKNSSTTG